MYSNAYWEKGIKTPNATIIEENKCGLKHVQLKYNKPKLY
jgi:hypothetical protein